MAPSQPFSSNTRSPEALVVVKTPLYQGIQRKIAELFPEDFYITDTLTLESDGDLKERHMLSQVQLAASQMIIYVDGLLRDYRTTSGTSPQEWGDLKTWGRDFGRDLHIARKLIRLLRDGELGLFRAVGPGPLTVDFIDRRIRGVDGGLPFSFEDPGLLSS